MTGSSPMASGDYRTRTTGPGRIVKHCEILIYGYNDMAVLILEPRLLSGPKATPYAPPFRQSTGSCDFDSRYSLLPGYNQCVCTGFFSGCCLDNSYTAGPGAAARAGSPAERHP